MNKVYVVVKKPNGTEEWRLNGQLHREDGPAYIGAKGNTKWYFKGQLHRVDGPAVEWTNGSKEYYLHGKRHRNTFPAVIRENGRKEWWCHGELHRKNGPAIIHTDGTKEFYKHGKKQRTLTKEEFLKAMKEEALKAWRKHGKRLDYNNPRQVKWHMSIHNTLNATNNTIEEYVWVLAASTCRGFNLNEIYFPTITSLTAFIKEYSSDIERLYSPRFPGKTWRFPE